MEQKDYKKLLEMGTVPSEKSPALYLSSNTFNKCNARPLCCNKCNMLLGNLPENHCKPLLDII